MTSIYTTCTCGNALSSYIEYYNAVKYDRFKTEMEKTYPGVNPALIDDTDIKYKMGDVLDDLHMDNECCRVKMITYHDNDPYIIEK